MTNQPKELPKAYDPNISEEKWYTFWEKNKLFKADPTSDKPPYCIVIPPPNVTGMLHMGHALVDTLQDILIRYHRMNGYETLWIPGTDHAGIATQTIVEKHLIKTEGKRRKDYSREEFLNHTWKWKEEKEDRILNQLKRLGCSCDWDMIRFTMDDQSNEAVQTVFKKMFDEKIIYRGDYLVNWDPVTQTALADDEVEYEEKDSHLWYFRYPVQDSKDYVIIATTRPETMLGDTALAVSPKDPRYQHLIGKNIILPIQNREIPVVADNYVDPEFGSGIVKITPAHDPNDYELGFRHNLPMINIMNPDGTINENGAKFEGLSMQDARKEVVAEMEKLGLLEKIEPYKLRVGVSYRSKAVIEPYLSKQWFVKMSVFKDKLISAVKEKRIELIPENFEKTYFHWIENLRDWCISRQLWWGHRIPIWYHKEDPEKIICHVGKDLPEEVIAEPDMWQQDEDVLDTWFSSGLWPFSVLGWPNQTDYLKKFYPTSVLVTGHDILFFWVARMIMMGEYVMEEIPFHKTFLHGLIYGKSYWRKNDSLIEYVPHSEKKAFDLGEPIPKDVSSKWEKMSKSKGNVIDPLEIIDEYGTDAMRIALCASTTHARQIDLDLRRFEEYRNFANKLWNGSRFILMNIAKENGLSKEELEKGLNFDIFSIEDRWILSLTNRTIENMRSAIDQFHFDKAASIAYDFFWNDFCAYYLELVKPYLFDKKGSLEEKRSKMKLLLIILIDIVRLLHPITPYITEEIFSLVKEIYGQFAINSGIDPYTKGTLNALNQIGCIVAPYPKVPNQKDIDSNIENTFAKIQKIILQIRNIRGEMSLPPSTVTDLYIHTTNAEEKTFLEKHIPLIETLIRIGNVHYVEKANLPKIGAIATLDETTFSIPLPHDLIEKEIKRLSKEQEKLEKAIESAKKKLSVQSFIEKAPSHVVEKMQETLKSDEETLCIIKEKIQTYQ